MPTGRIKVEISVFALTNDEIGSAAILWNYTAGLKPHSQNIWINMRAIAVTALVSHVYLRVSVFAMLFTSTYKLIHSEAAEPSMMMPAKCLRFRGTF